MPCGNFSSNILHFLFNFPELHTLVLTFPSVHIENFLRIIPIRVINNKTICCVFYFNSQDKHKKDCEVKSLLRFHNIRIVITFNAHTHTDTQFSNLRHRLAHTLLLQKRLKLNLLMQLLVLLLSICCSWRQT